MGRGCGSHHTPIISNSLHSPMLSPHCRFMSIDSKIHRQKGRIQVNTCLRKLVLGNYLRTVSDEVNMEKEMLEQLSMLRY